jgi:hypothetical protein
MDIMFLTFAEFDADEAELERIVFSVADGSAGKEETLAFFARHVV